MTHRNSLNQLEQNLEGMIDTQSAALATPLWNLDHEQIKLSLEAIVANREIIAVRIYNEDGSLMRETGQLVDSENLIVLQRDVLHDAGLGKKAIGNLEFVATTKYLWDQTRLRLMVAAIIVLIAVMIEVGAALFALRRIVGVPLSKLLSSINKAREGSDREQVEWQSGDEMGQVITAFNEMQNQQEEYEQDLRTARDSLEIRVNERTAELLAASKEATRARSQLTAAIENVSEGFSLFDSDDKLVICNARYQELLRPEVDREIAKGTPFEQIVRDAAENGLIVDANEDPEHWISQRLERHHNPGEPHLQHRSDNRWILVSERKTDEGGTVA
ncbi:PAS-domain containing protein, partial [Pseudomonadota bacterium]